MRRPAKQPRRGKLRERAPRLPATDAGVGVGNGGG